MGILVLALNPSIDAEWSVDRVQWEEKNVLQSERRWAGGKGVNVARWLRHLRGEPKLLIPLGGSTGDELNGYLRSEHLTARVIPLREGTRVNVIVTVAAGGQLRFNPPGPRLSGANWQSLLQHTRKLLRRTTCLVLSGSLPPGLPPDAYAQLTRCAHRAGVRTILDCDGVALKKAIPARPYLVKPNEHELAQWLGKPLRSETAILEAAGKLSMATRGWVAVSLGKRGGLLVNAMEQFGCFARPPKVQPTNTVGAGDAMVAAMALQIDLGASPEEWLRSGVATGTAATQCVAGELPGPGLVKRVLGKVSLSGKF